MEVKEGRFDILPNEIYYCIFDYFNPIDLLYSFSNVNNRFNYLLKKYSRSISSHLNLTELNDHVLTFYKNSLNKQINKPIDSLILTSGQFQFISSLLNNGIRQLTILIEKELHFRCEDQFLLEYLEKLTIKCHSLTWERPLIICPNLKEVKIHLRNHADLLQLLNSLPIVEKVHATIDYDVTSSKEICSLKFSSYSKRLIDFSYLINPEHGLLYFVTDYSQIEFLVQQLTNVQILHLYIIGCFNTIIDGNRFERNLFKYLIDLKEFHFFIQSYGGQRIESMDQFSIFEWNFGSYSNQLTDMYYLFTLPFQFQRLDQCINEYFLQGIQTTFSKSIFNEKLLGMTNVKHLDLSCSITQNLLLILRQSFLSLESIRFSSSTAEYLSPPSLSRESLYRIKSIRSVTFDQSCRYQSPILRLFPYLNQLILDQSLLNHFLEETGDGYIYQVKQLHLYSFQQHYFPQIIHSFTNLDHLKLQTLQRDDQGPIRSFLDGRCYHKHRPVSITDLLDQLFKSHFYRLKYFEVGCFFERDEEHIQPILSKYIYKYRNQSQHFTINSEHFKSTRCGTIQIHFF